MQFLIVSWVARRQCHSWLSPFLPLRIASQYVGEQVGMIICRKAVLDVEHFH